MPLPRLWALGMIDDFIKSYCWHFKHIIYFFKNQFTFLHASIFHVKRLLFFHKYWCYTITELSCLSVGGGTTLVSDWRSDESYHQTGCDMQAKWLTAGAPLCRALTADWCTSSVTIQPPQNGLDSYHHRLTLWEMMLPKRVHWGKWSRNVPPAFQWIIRMISKIIFYIVTCYFFYIDVKTL